jgi:hypothetical protein
MDHIVLNVYNFGRRIGLGGFCCYVQMGDAKKGHPGIVLAGKRLVQ